jgi:acyl-lipid omega-6 desaturase (Delta-12 desaturase)
LRDNPQFAGVGRITLLQSLRTVRLTLWDEERQRLVSFGEAALFGKAALFEKTALTPVA